MPVVLTRDIKLYSPAEIVSRLAPHHVSMLRKLAREDLVGADSGWWAKVLETMWRLGLVEKEVFDNRLRFRITTFGVLVAKEMEKKHGKG